MYEDGRCGDDQEWTDESPPMMIRDKKIGNVFMLYCLCG